MSTTPNALFSIADAILGVEQSDANYQKAVTQTAADQALADAAQKKADDAKTVVDNDKVTQRAAAKDRNTALRSAIQVLTANIIPDADADPQAGS